MSAGTVLSVTGGMAQRMLESTLSSLLHILLFCDLQQTQINKLFLKKRSGEHRAPAPLGDSLGTSAGPHRPQASEQEITLLPALPGS